jgi:plastocyanin
MRGRLLAPAVLAAALACAIGAAIPAQAAIDSTTGQIQLVAPPAGVLFPPHPGDPCPTAGACLQSDSTMFAFNEQQCVKAPSNLPVDITQPGTYDDSGDLTSGSIPAGTFVSSQFVQSEQETPNHGPALQFDGTVHTDAPIIGIAILADALNGTDVLGAPGTLYPTNVFGRGLNLDGQNDFVIQMVDSRTVEIHSQVNLHADQVRIITSCTGTIIVKKLTNPSGDPAQFQFTGDASGTIGDGQTIVVSGLAPGTYSSTEQVPSGWKLSSLTCDDSDSTGDTSTATATFQLQAGETVTCTFTDAKTGTLIVKKKTVPAGASTQFAFTGDASGSIGDGQSITVSGLLPGTYTSQEQVPSGWKLTGLTCDDSDSTGDLGSATATFRIAAGETVTCTFTDTKTGKIIVYKKTWPWGDPTYFTFTGDAAGKIKSGQSIVVGGLLPGTYTSHEVVPSGWKLAFIKCDDYDSSGNIWNATATFHLSAGETVTCYFIDVKRKCGWSSGWWKNSDHFGDWRDYTKYFYVDTVFNVSSFSRSLTLLQALQLDGSSGLNALAREGVAALLNSIDPDLDYPLDGWQVLKSVHDAIASRNTATINALASQLAAYNSLDG